MTLEERAAAWELESGLPNDFDGKIINARFGTKDEYAAKVAQVGGEGKMLLFDLMDETGEIVATQGFSIGTGWTVSDDGKSISHPKRHNVVESSMYGQLQLRVVKELKVDLVARGFPTESSVWDGLAFHWMMQSHKTVGGSDAQGLMPTAIVDMGSEPVSKSSSKSAEPQTEVDKKLQALVDKHSRHHDFMMAAIKLPEVVNNEKIMAQVVNDGEEGYYASHKKK